MMLTSQKPCQYNNKFDCSEIDGYNIPKDAINEVKVFSININSDILLKKHKLICSFNRIMDFNRAEPTCYRNKFPLVSSGFFIPISTPYIHPRVDEVFWHGRLLKTFAHMRFLPMSRVLAKREYTFCLFVSILYAPVKKNSVMSGRWLTQY